MILQRCVYLSTCAVCYMYNPMVEQAWRDTASSFIDIMHIHMYMDEYYTHTVSSCPSRCQTRPLLLAATRPLRHGRQPEYAWTKRGGRMRQWRRPRVAARGQALWPDTQESHAYLRIFTASLL